MFVFFLEQNFYVFSFLQFEISGFWSIFMLNGRNHEVAELFLPFKNFDRESATTVVLFMCQDIVAKHLYTQVTGTGVPVHTAYHFNASHPQEVNFSFK